MQLTPLFPATGYVPHAGQIRFHESDARFKILIAGARFGKSLAGTKDVLAELTSGNSRGWMVAPTYALAQPEFRYIVQDVRRRLGVPAAAIDGGRGSWSRMRTPWGAEVYCLSAQRHETLLGEEIDWLILCEAAHLDREAFERFLRARLTTRRGRLVVPTTPHGFNWVHELYQEGQADNDAWASFRFATWDNPLISAAEIEAARASLPADVFDEQYGGAFTTPSGAVYREFQPALHVVKGLQAPPGAIIYKAIDFGFTNPFCCLWAAVDGDSRLLVLREHYLKSEIVDRHAEVIRAVDDAFVAAGQTMGPAFADPSGRMERQTLTHLGIANLKADNNIAGGVQMVRRMLAPREDGTPGMYIDAGCRNLLREFEQYMWQESSAPGEKVPRKEHDHALDALRYLCVALQSRVDWQKQGAIW
jgi:hypothetical protein